MKKLPFPFIAVFLILLFSGNADAWRGGMKWEGSGGSGLGAKYHAMYDTKTVATISGVVEKVERFTPERGMRHGIHLLVKTDAEKLSVHLGPAWFLEKQDIKIEAKDKVEVTGSRITFDGKPAIIAATIIKGDETLVLRDGAGIPVWAGWRKQ